MSDENAALPPLNHNNPPPDPIEVPTADLVTAWLDYDCAKLKDRGDEIIAGWQRFVAAHPTITSQDVQGKAGDFDELIRKFLTACDAERKARKEPFADGGKAVDGWFKGVTDAARPEVGVSVSGVRDKLKAMRNAFALAQEAENRRRAQEEAERKAAEAAAQLAAAAEAMDPRQLEAAAKAAEQAETEEQRATSAPAAAHTRVYGEHGSVTSLRSRWVFVEAKSDLMALCKAVVEGKAPLAMIDFNRIAIGQAVRSEHLRELPGCAIEEVKSV